MIWRKSISILHIDGSAGLAVGWRYLLSRDGLVSIIAYLITLFFS
jgi:hypothetical protein